MNQPARKTRCAGLNASFSSAASGSPALTVQWQVSTNGTGQISPSRCGIIFATVTADNNKTIQGGLTNSSAG
jgi:hypothetical protein